MRFAVAATLALALGLALPVAAWADPMPAGTYDLTTNGSTVQLGSFFPALALPATGPAAVPIGTQPAQLSLPVTGTYPGSFNSPITGGTLGGTYTITVSSASLSIDPAAGSGSLDLSLYGSFSVNAVILTVPSSTTCTLGSAGAPVNLHLTTASGAPWSATTGNYGMADKTFVIPALACNDLSLQSILALLVGGTTPGSNSADTTGSAKREPDATRPPTTSTPPPMTSTPPSTSGTPATTPTAGKAMCVVPKLKGKTLKQVRKALTKAHCRLGKVRRVRRRQHARKGAVVRQGARPGKRLPAGARVAVTLARGR